MLCHTVLDLRPAQREGYSTFIAFYTPDCETAFYRPRKGRYYVVPAR